MYKLIYELIYKQLSVHTVFEKLFRKIHVSIGFSETKHVISIQCTFGCYFRIHCVKSVRIRSYSSPYSVRMRENADQKNSEYGHFLRSDSVLYLQKNMNRKIISRQLVINVSEEMYKKKKKKKKHENKHHKGFKDFRFRTGAHILPHLKNLFINNQFEKDNLACNKYF